MALILNIDTALDTACISLAENGQVLQAAYNNEQKDHAAWIQPAIKELLSITAKNIDELNGIAVNYGPGSYTGLRVGLSTAKGLCYVLNIPLITISSLELLAFSAVKNSEINTGNLLFCPMIDARRMEVFTAVYDMDLAEIVKPIALILTEHSFNELLKWHKILFLGNGSAKFQSICKNPNAFFQKTALNAAELAQLSYKNFIGNNFANLAYTEPLYIKEFHIIPPRKIGD